MTKTDEFQLQIFHDRTLRRAVARRSHYWFFHLYLPHYVKHRTAYFHKEMFAVTEDKNIRTAVIVAFRGSGKSTIMALSYPLWAMIGEPRKKFIIILSQTQRQSQLILSNIKQELETNDLLIADFGPFSQQADEWRANSLVLPQYGTRITALSSGESIRGVRHLEHRPDLIICDDVEDLTSVKTKEGRDKTYHWLTGEVIPAGDQQTKMIVIGNLLHEDSLIKRLHKNIEEERLKGIFRAYPLLDDAGNVLWPDKYPDEAAIKRQRMTVASESSWQREYLLRIIADEDRIVHREWIQYYDTLPKDDEGLRYIATGIDLAISEKATANYTAMVSAYICGYGEDLRVYILPNPVNKRMSFPDTFETAKRLSMTLGDGHYTRLIIEDVGYQRSLVQQLLNAGYPAEEMKIKGHDKRERLSLTTHLIQQGKILFPRKGAEPLIQQLVGFGVEKYDDLVDAFTVLILKIAGEDTSEPGFAIISFESELPSYGTHRPLSMDMEF